MAKLYEIGFEEESEFIILSETSIHNIIVAIKNGHSNNIRVNIELLVPVGYGEYISNVININREHKLFQYNYIHKKEIDYNDILLILKRQINLLIINNARCFTKVSLRNIGRWGYFILKLNPEVISILRDKKRGFFIQKYNHTE